MSMPIANQPPTVFLPERFSADHGGHTSNGTVIPVMVAVIVLGIAAGMIGRLCSGRRVVEYGDYDIESWAERKCSSCIDGRIDPSPPPRSQGSATCTPATMPADAREEEAKPEDQSPQNPSPSADS